MKKFLFFIFLLFVLFENVYSQVWEEHGYFDVENIRYNMKRVADWQLDHLLYESGGGYGNMGLIREDSWARAVFYLGVLSTYKTTGDRKYVNEAMTFAERNNWKVGFNLRNADDLTVGQVYLELYGLQEREKDAKRLESLKSCLDIMYENPKTGKEYGWDKNLNWSWSDALFMVPPSIARLYSITKDEKYLRLLDMYYWESYDLLFDKDDSLFYRDQRYCFSREGKAKTMSGKKVFWLRGNAWVIGGLVGILKYMPKSYASYNRYLSLYKQMAKRLLSLQQIDGLWRSSLLEPWQFPEKETSGSGLICYALAWGINQGILDAETYENPIKRTWIALCECVDSNGRLAWVQPVGHDPQHIKSTDTMEYGTGAFLMAGREIYIMSFVESVKKRHYEDSIY